MISQKVTIKNKSGIHARPAGMFVKTTGSCSSDVKILYNGKVIEGKSILNIMAAGIRCGTEIEIQCDGQTEEEDLKKIIQVIEDGLGES